MARTVPESLRALIPSVLTRVRHDHRPRLDGRRIRSQEGIQLAAEHGRIRRVKVTCDRRPPDHRNHPLVSWSQRRGRLER